MRKLVLLFLVCAACGTKKPAQQPAPVPPPAAQPADESKAPDADKSSNTKRTGDPCDGGEKPK